VGAEQLRRLSRSREILKFEIQVLGSFDRLVRAERLSAARACSLSGRGGGGRERVGERGFGFSPTVCSVALARCTALVGFMARGAGDGAKGTSVLSLFFYSAAPSLPSTLSLSLYPPLPSTLTLVLSFARSAARTSDDRQGGRRAAIL
jgi:hypothetical protein